MPSERIQRQIDQHLDAAEQASLALDWTLVREHSQAVLDHDGENADAVALLAASERALSRTPLVPEVSAPVASLAEAPPGTPPKPAPAMPTSFVNGRYVMERFLGEGGKKRVYLCHDTLLDRPVAFALIKIEGLDDVGRQRIKREAQNMGRLGNHPYIVTVYDIGEENGQPYIICQFMAGGDVEGLIVKADGHKLSIERVLEIAKQVCNGMAFAHSKGVIHRDIKPGNIWLTAEGVAKIGDFGLARSVDRSRLTQAGMMIGTVAYMPPEQALGGGGEADPRSDLYSFGVMLYEMICGRPPFIGTTAS